MSKFKKIFALVLVVATISALCVGFAGCSNDEDANMLLVATEACFPPYEYINEKSEFTGFDIDLMYAIARKLGYDDIKIVEVKFDGILSAVASDANLVGVSAINILPERADEVNFSVPYLSDKYQVVVYEKGNEVLEAIDPATATKEDIITALKDQTINYAKGQTSEFLVKGSDKLGYSPIACKESKMASDAVKSIDAINSSSVAIVDNDVAKEQIRRNDKLAYIDVSIAPEEYAIAINKSNTTLKEKIDNVILELKADGTIDALKKKYSLDSID